MTILLKGDGLTIEQVVRVARSHERVALDPVACAALQRSRDFVDGLSKDQRVVYGVTTGFGLFKNVIITPDQVEELQRNLIMSHAIGAGPAMAEEDVRAAILIRISSLLHGYSGIRLSVVQALVDLLNHDVYPYVPSQGSVGSSGDLAPLSHIMLVIMGMGEVIVDGKRRPTAEVLREKGLATVTLQSKEGLALNNGTAVQTGIGCLAYADACRLAKLADLSLSMSLESLMGSVKAFDSRIHRLRPHRGQVEVAENMRRLCVDSEIIASHANCGRVQDAYSLRCAAQVHGACRDGMEYVRGVLEKEVNAVTDNPLIFADDNEVISGGNFHGEPIALAMDHLKICASELANIAERRIAKMVDPATSEGLPAFLIAKEKAGLNSGYMIAQYTAAALVSENKVLAHPASVDSIPTSANQEDHVSMGTIAARQAREIVRNSLTVIVIEMMCAAQALDFRLPLLAGRGTRTVHAHVRRIIPSLTQDRILYEDLERLRAACVRDEFLAEIEASVGGLK